MSYMCYFKYKLFLSTYCKNCTSLAQNVDILSYFLVIYVDRPGPNIYSIQIK